MFAINFFVIFIIFVVVGIITILNYYFHLHYTASELQAWLLYYGLPCLVGYLPDKYLQHFAHLAEGIYILLGDSISQALLDRAQDLLTRFYRDFQGLYGECLTYRDRLLNQTLGWNMHWSAH